MKLQKLKKDSFVIIGKEGSTLSGDGFIKKLWQDANEHYGEIENLVIKDEQGKPIGIWGAMSDFSHSFQPWEDNFKKGLYLAGAECRDDAEPPVGWVKWVIPGYEYLYTECDGNDTFNNMLKYMNENNIPLVGAVHDFTCPRTGKNYMYFPINKL